jgi:hypothetical protein
MQQQLTTSSVTDSLVRELFLSARDRCTARVVKAHAANRVFHAWRRFIATITQAQLFHSGAIVSRSVFKARARSSAAAASSPRICPRRRCCCRRGAERLGGRGCSKRCTGYVKYRIRMTLYAPGFMPLGNTICEFPTTPLRVVRNPIRGYVLCAESVQFKFSDMRAPLKSLSLYS